MDGDRCVRCAATLPVGAPWCTLCFAPAENAPESAQQAVADLALIATPALALPLPAGRSRPGPADAPDLSPENGRSEAPASSPALTWPCQSCSSAVPLAQARCPSCGAAFLAGALEAPSLSLPGVGNLLARSRGQRLLIGAGVSLLLLVVLLAIMWLLGSLL